MEQRLTVDFPVNGELINHAHDISGNVTPSAIEIEVRGTTVPGRKVSINGILAEPDEEGAFNIPVTLEATFPELVIDDGTDVVMVRPVCDFSLEKRYNFFIDDNSFFLTEIVRNGYQSIFDSFYLGFLRRLHNDYGMKVTLNTFFRNDHDPFLLTEVPERYKDEWAGNADWLRFAPHSYSEFPDHPYTKAFPEKLPEHFDAITEQICRFAGDGSVIAPVILHFYGVDNDDSMHFLRKYGMKYFSRPESFWKDLREKYGRDFFGFYDFEHEMLQIPVEFMCNLLTAEQIREYLNSMYRKPGKNIINFGSHEQYSYPYYSNYLPDHFERIETAVKSLHENGFESIFLSDCGCK